MNNIKNNARFLRLHRGNSIGEIAKSSGIPPMTLRRFESECNMTMRNVKLIADCYGVPIDVLVNNLSALSGFINTPAKTNRKLAARYEKIQRSRTRNGITGEDWVFLQEYEKLEGTPFRNLINANYAEFPTAHFDIQSFDRDGNVLVIEVKTTNGDANEPFYMSVAEYRFASACLKDGTCYEIHRVFHVNTDPQRIIITAEELFRDYKPAPDNYRLERKSA